MAEKIIETKKHCIWMDAGVIQFKFCDSDFDCLSCQFDRAMIEAATQHQARRELERNLRHTKQGIQTWRSLCPVDGKCELRQVL